ncbi:MAG TPA: DUF1343 domain-containing protein [Puia sp.]|nr:DUF1343 domain-containing protein [Puia sp.]
MQRTFFFLTVLSIHLLAKAQPLTGADQMDRYLPQLRGKRVAVFANATSVINGVNLVDTLVKKGINIVEIFSPEHGFRGDADAGATVGNQRDASTGIPIVSLYGPKRKPSADDLKDVDVMLYDIQDVGVRFYTYISSLQHYLESAIENHRPLIILDRPDPNGSYVDGPVLDTAFRSFVGSQPVPVVYGMTIGEYARMLLGEGWVKQTPDFKLTIIRCKNYTHHTKYTLPTKPSPNLPNMQSVWLYPSLCFFEGTVISLGRGTPKPFQVFGNPKFPDSLFSFTPESVPGATKPPLMGQRCYGYDLSGIDVAAVTGNKMSLRWLIEAYSLYPDKDHFFNGNGSGFDRLAGSSELRRQLRQGLTEEEIRKTWEPALGHFKTIRKKYLLYAE